MMKRLDLHDPNKYDLTKWRLFRKRNSPIYRLENLQTHESITVGRNIIGLFQLSDNEFLAHSSVGQGRWKLVKFAVVNGHKKIIFSYRFGSTYIVDNSHIELDGKIIIDVYKNEVYDSPAAKSGNRVSTKPFTI